MREIKFRGHNGARWIYSEAIWFNRFPTLNDIMVCMYDSEDESQDELNIETWDTVCYLGQYTGSKDENRKEIYEGDIVRFLDEITIKEEGYLDTTSVVEKVGVVVWDNEELGYNVDVKCENEYHYLSCCEGVEVIGNIYENKDLLG